jgi:hypothetical protein
VSPPYFKAPKLPLTSAKKIGVKQFCFAPKFQSLRRYEEQRSE